MPYGIRESVEIALRKRRLRWTGEARRLLGLSTDEDVEMLRMMQHDNAAAPPAYHAGSFWREINEEFTRLAHAGALVNLRDEYFNRRFSGPEPSSRQVYKALLKVYWDRLVPRDTSGFLQNHEDSDAAGISDCETVHGKRLSLDFLQSVDEAFLLREQLSALRKQPVTPRVIVELGAGYGRLAYVCRRMFPDCTYIMLDLPEALTCAHSFLRRALPGDVVPYQRSRLMNDLDRAALESEKVWLLGAHQIETLRDDVADAFVNVYSLAEMPPAAISNYTQHIDRLTAGVFLTKQRLVERNATDYGPIDESSYPVPSRWRSLAYGTSSLYEEFFEAVYSTRG